VIAGFKGGLIFTRQLPSKAPGLQEKSDSAAIGAISAKFKLTDEAKLADALHAAAPRDWNLPPEIGVVHRETAAGDVYFVANSANHAVKFTPSFRAKGGLTWWDPSTGKESDPHGVLAPYESRIVVVGGAGAGRSTPAEPEGRTIELADWKLTIGGEAKGVWPPFYSGTGTYEKSVNLPSAPAHAWLDFGEGTPVDPNAGRRPANGMRALLESPVREAAQVWVNGKLAGSVWKPPYRVDISGLLKSGDNAIKIVVGNLALNEMASKPLPDYKELTAKFGERFQAQDMQDVKAMPSGLQGPVRLVSR
jgi:hypothetical protein